MIPKGISRSSQASEDSSEIASDCAIHAPRRKWGGRKQTTASCITTDVVVHEDFASVCTLFGRDLQLKSVNDAYERISAGGSEAVLVNGASGTGKSVLVESMRDLVTNDDGGYYVSGKFDQLQTRKEPFSAIASALSDICDLILQSNQFDDRRKDIVDKLQSLNCEILSKVVPNVAQVTGELDLGTEAPMIHSEIFTRFNLACQQFLRAVATKEHPLFIFLDDIQWADELSVELIRSMITDLTSQHVLFCIASRGDGATSEIIFGGDTVDDSNNRLPCTEITLENLDEEEVSTMLCHLLLTEYDLVSPLAALLLGKTRGNPNLVVQQLEMLKSKQLLIYCDETYSWTWNIHSIEPEVSDDPTQMIAHKYNNLDSEDQEILTFGAYIGHTISLDTLQSILLHDRGVTVTSEEADAVRRQMKKTTENAILNGLVEEQKQGVLNFCHDSIQGFIHDSVESGLERELLQLRIGRALMRSMEHDNSSEENVSSVFLAANNMISGSRHIVEDKERLATMKLWVDAANLAASKAAVFDAREYLECTIKFQTESDYDVAYSLCLDARNLYAEIQSATGAFVDSNEAVEVVLKRARSVDDRLRAYFTKLRSLAAESKYKEMFDLAVNEVLPPLGETIPRRPSRASLLVSLFRMKMTLRKMKPEDFLSLSPMVNNEKFAAMKMLGFIGPIALSSCQPGLYLSCVIRRIRLSIEYGVSPYTAAALAGYAVILQKLGKMDDAYELGRVSVKLAARWPTMGSICLTCVTRFVDPWRVHLADLAEPMRESCHMGLKSSAFLTDTFYAICAYTELRRSLFEPLAELESEMSEICDRIEKFHVPRFFLHRLLLLQYLQNLLGRSESVLVLTGEAMDWQEFEKSLLEDHDVLGLHQLHIYRLRLQIEFEDWEAAGETLPKLTSADVSYFSSDFTYLLAVAEIALSSLTLYDVTKESKHRKIGRRYMRKMKQWWKGGVPDAQPLWLLINAEWKSSVENDHLASVAFDDAIKALQSNQLVGFECLAYQRAMHSMLKVSCFGTAHKYLAASLERNRAWGNVAKVAFLESKYAYLSEFVKPPTYAITVEQMEQLDLSSQCSEPNQLPKLFLRF